MRSFVVPAKITIALTVACSVGRCRETSAIAVFKTMGGSLSMVSDKTGSSLKSWKLAGVIARGQGDG